MLFVLHGHFVGSLSQRLFTHTPVSRVTHLKGSLEIGSGSGQSIGRQNGKVAVGEVMVEWNVLSPFGRLGGLCLGRCFG